MKSKKFTKKELINLLVKKASGFYYTEEQFEYEKRPFNTKNELKNNENKSKIEKKSKNSVIVSGKTNTTNDTIELSNINHTQSNQSNDDLSLSKKKTSTHYIPPDMIAIKILFEIFEKKVVGNEIEKLNDEELLNLKNKLLEELKNENN